MEPGPAAAATPTATDRTSTPRSPHGPDRHPQRLSNRGLMARSTGGLWSFGPVVIFKLQLVMFFEGVRSERQLMAVAADRLSVRWFVGYDLDEPLPDHSSLTRIAQGAPGPLWAGHPPSVLRTSRGA